eukprot:scaffold50520_cov62-Phaeocystis_antarctica.AAC.2
MRFSAARSASSTRLFTLSSSSRSGLLVGCIATPRSRRSLASSSLPSPPNAWPWRSSSLSRSASSGRQPIACSHSSTARACSSSLSAHSAALE